MSSSKRSGTQRDPATAITWGGPQTPHHSSPPHVAPAVGVIQCTAPQRPLAYTKTTISRGGTRILHHNASQHVTPAVGVIQCTARQRPHGPAQYLYSIRLSVPPAASSCGSCLQRAHPAPGVQSRRGGTRPRQAAIQIEPWA